MSQKTETPRGLVRAAVGLLSAAILLAGAVAAPPRVQEGGSGSSACALVQRALDDSVRIRPGTMRKELEKYFRYDGGAQFPNNARYVWAACEYLKLDVEFDPAPSRGNGLTSPEDTVRRVSKLYVEYPARD